MRLSRTKKLGLYLAASIERSDASIERRVVVVAAHFGILYTQILVIVDVCVAGGGGE